MKAPRTSVLTEATHSPPSLGITPHPEMLKLPITSGKLLKRKGQGNLPISY